MAREKLSGSLLACRDAPPAITPAQNLGAVRHGADEKALGAPVLIWSTRQKNKAEPNTAEDLGGAGHRVPASPHVTDLDPPEVTAEKASGNHANYQSGRLDGPSPALRWRAVAVAVSVFAVGGVSGLLLLPPSGAKHSAEIPLSIAPPTITEKLTSGVVGPEQQPSAKAATAVPSQSAPDSVAANGVPTSAAPHEILPDHQSTGTPDTASIAASADPAVPGDASARIPKVSDGAPSADFSVGAANSSRAQPDSPASAALNAALLERGDSLFVTGDFYSARLFYERAANAGHGDAALRLGETYDPAFLTRMRFIGAPANAATAAYWYQRAHELGVPEAEILLKAIAAEIH